MLIEQYRKPGTPTTNETFNAVLEKKIKAWAEANVDASHREDIRSEGLQREFTKEKAKKCIAKHTNRNAAYADQVVNDFMKYRGGGMLTVMVVLNNWIWKTNRHREVERRSSREHVQERRRD